MKEQFQALRNQAPSSRMTSELVPQKRAVTYG